MNKSEFIEALKSKTDYTAEQCAVINDILENHFILRKKNKPKVTAELCDRLGVDQATASDIYDMSVGIIKTELKNAARRPFGSNISTVFSQKADGPKSVPSAFPCRSTVYYAHGLRNVIL